MPRGGREGLYGAYAQDVAPGLYGLKVSKLGTATVFSL